MFTQRYPLDQVNAAFEAVMKGVDASGKSVIKVALGPDY